MEGCGELLGLIGDLAEVGHAEAGDAQFCQVDADLLISADLGCGIVVVEVIAHLGAVYEKNGFDLLGVFTRPVVGIGAGDGVGHEDVRSGKASIGKCCTIVFDDEVQNHIVVGIFAEAVTGTVYEDDQVVLFQAGGHLSGHNGVVVYAQSGETDDGMGAVFVSEHRYVEGVVADGDEVKVTVILKEGLLLPGLGSVYEKCDEEKGQDN